jgi:glucuronoarabinoxylan endo-1,4-beta-xylanase
MKCFRILGVLLALAICQRTLGQTTTVTWMNVHQTIDGFGASDWGTAESISDVQADLFFSVPNGIGLSFVVHQGNEECADTISDLVTLQKAVARGARVWATMNPPISMKDSGKCTTGNLLSGSYAAYATYIVNYIGRLKADGITLYAVTPTNEPDIAGGGNIGGLYMSGQQIHDFIRYDLGPAMATAGLSTKVMAASQGQWFFDYAAPTMSDPAAAAYVSILSSHGYGYYPNTSTTTDGFGNYACCSTATPAPFATSTGQLWQSEVSHSGLGNTFDGSMGDALVWAHNIHDYMTVANVTGWMYWMLNGNSWFNDNEGLTDVNENPAKRLYVIGNYSKFVRPGWVRIDATANPQGGVYVSAYKETATGNFAIVVVNQNGNAVEQIVSLSGFNSASVTPWVTSASLNLAQQSGVSVANNAFSYSLPAQSVTTFVGVMGGGSAGGHPNPPTGLTVVVH